MIEKAEVETLLEANLVQLPTKFTIEQKETYFSGYIESLRDTKQITPELADNLYLEWGAADENIREVRRESKKGIY